MTTSGDATWTCVAAVPNPGDAASLPVQIEFLFMVNGSQQPSYFGWGGPDACDLAFGANLPNVVLSLESGGWYTFTLDEAAPACTVAPALGSIVATVQYSGGSGAVSDGVREATRCAVRDQTAGASLGSFPYDLGAQALPIPNLLPAHSYELTFTAPGFHSKSLVVAPPDALAYNVDVTLQKIVPAESATWGSVKSLYR